MLIGLQKVVGPVAWATFVEPTRAKRTTNLGNRARTDIALVLGEFDWLPKAGVEVSCFHGC